MTTADWTALATHTTDYTARVSVTDPVSSAIDVTYCGLYTTLSAVLQDIPAAQLHSVAVFADTLVVDVPALSVAGLVLLARSLDVTPLAGQPLVLTPPAGGAVVQILAGGTIGGPFRLGASSEDAAPVTVPTSATALGAGLYTAGAGGSFTSQATGGAQSVADLVSRSWTMNAYQAGYAAASRLIDDSEAGDRAIAQAMLSWIVTGSVNLALNQQLPSDYSQLYNQAAALLVTLSAAPGATFVPILSDTYYSQQTSSLVQVIRDYEGYAATLATQTDIATAIATVSSSLAGTATDEIAPLQTQLASISANTKSLFGDISGLRSKFDLQRQRAHTAFLIMGDVIALGNIKAQLEAQAELAMNLFSAGFSVFRTAEGDVGSMKDAAESSYASVKQLIVVIEAGKGDGGDDLSGPAVDLLNSQLTLMQTVLNGRLLWEQALAGKSGAVLPTSLSAVTLDPVTDWDAYIAGAEAEIAAVKSGTDDNGKNAADAYLASLKILAAYGKAIGGKFVAYVAQLVQASIVMAQIKAAKDIEARWEKTQAKATSDAERLAALKAVVQSRLQAVKRSLYVAWSYYSASYFYLNFVAPPRILHLDMTAAQIGEALVGVADWVAQAIGTAPDGQHVQLPNNNAQIELDYTIVGPATTAITGDTAVLTAVEGGGWSLGFTLAPGSAQLDGVLPNNGRCAIWISQAQFFLDGVTGNAKGNVLVSVATSGTYQNGTAAAGFSTFVTQGLTGYYGYTADTGAIYSPWQIDSAVYMTPTPYTQWTMTFATDGGDPSAATRLRVKLTVAYLV